MHRPRGKRDRRLEPETVKYSVLIVDDVTGEFGIGRKWTNTLGVSGVPVLSRDGNTQPGSTTFHRDAAVGYDRPSEIVFLTWSFLVTIQVRLPQRRTCTTTSAGAVVEITRKYRQRTQNYVLGFRGLCRASILPSRRELRPKPVEIYCIWLPFLSLVGYQAGLHPYPKRYITCTGLNDVCILLEGYFMMGR